MRQAWAPHLGSHPGSPQRLSMHPQPGLGPWVNPSPGCWGSWDVSLSAGMGSEDGHGAPRRVCWEDFNKVTQGFRVMSGTEQTRPDLCSTSSRGGALPPHPTCLPLAPGARFALIHIPSPDLSPRRRTSRASPPRLHVPFLPKPVHPTVSLAQEMERTSAGSPRPENEGHP